MIKAWTTENYEHEGKFWNLRLPLLRPRPYTKPHPRIIRACSSEEAMLGMARAGRPFLMNIQSNEVTRHRMDRYRETMREAGFDEATVARNVTIPGCGATSSSPRPTPRPSASRCPRSRPSRNSARPCARSVYEEQGLLLKQETAPAARNQAQHSILCGSPATVAEAIAEIDAIGVGGLILAFRIGPMPGEVGRAEHPAVHGEGRAGVPLARRLRAE